MARRSESSVLRTLRDQFGLTGGVADAVLDALTDEGFNPNVNTLGPSSEWVVSGRLFDVLDEVEAVQEELSQAEAALPDVAHERFLEARILSSGVLDEYEDMGDDYDFYPGEEIEITFTYEEKK